MMRLRAAAARGDRGAYAVLYAITLTVAIGMVALVVDLAMLRLDRRANRAAADSAAIAGSSELGLAGDNPVGACRKAIAYAKAGLGISSGPADNCGSAFFAAPAKCAAGLPVTASEALPYPGTGEVDPARYRIEVIWPIPEDDELLTSPDREGSATVSQPWVPRDGGPCQRLAVRIVQDRDFSFAGIFGFSGQTTSSHSVGLAVADDGGGSTFAPLVSIRPTDCPGLRVSAGAQVVVEASGDGMLPGTISVDSDGTGAGCAYAIDVDGGQLLASSAASGSLGQILSYALSGAGASNAYEPGDVCTRLCPQPVPRVAQVETDPWDIRYNCTRPDPECRLADGSLLPATPRDYVNQWRDFASGLEAAQATLRGWEVIPNADPDADFQCTITTNHEFTRDVFADCDPLRIEANVTFEGHLVTTGNVLVSGCLIIGKNYSGDCSAPPSPVNAASPGMDGGSVYVHGDLSYDGPDGDLIVDQSFVYVRGQLSLGGSGHTTSWVGPYGSQQDCTAGGSSDPPSSSCFEDLGLWSPSGIHHISMANAYVDGTLFLRQGSLTLHDDAIKSQDRAQFVARILQLSGDLVLAPNETRTTPIDGSSGSLIR